MRKVNPSPPIRQLVLRKMGMFGSSYMGNDIYFLIEAMNIMIGEIGEENMKQICEEKGKDWEKIKDRLDRMNEVATEIKMFYDAIEDKKFIKKDIDETKTQLMFKKHFRENAGRFSLVQRELFSYLIMLLDITEIKHFPIPNEAWKIIEHTGMKTTDLTSRKSPQSQDNVVKKEE